MRSLKNLGRLAIAGACLFAIVILTGNSATARPQYEKAMSKAYPDLTKKHGKDGKLACTVCHPNTKTKKERNNYGAAFGKGLEMKNEKDDAKLKAALDKAAKEKSATEGKTFGDLIEAGELPGTDEVVK
ncbi:MAG: hypothetical protein R3C59_18680 [Planctomycetaceae bacterium]